MKILQPGINITEFINSPDSDMRKILGCHYSRKKRALVIRAFMPNVERVYVLRKDTNTQHQMKKVHDEGLFEAVFLRVNFVFKYQFIIVTKDGSDLPAYDPYSFNTSTFSDDDIELIEQGRHFHIFKKLGSHMMEFEGVQGVNFALLHPSAKRVSLVGSFNNWDNRCHHMKRRNGTGIWEMFIPGLSEGERYQYEVYEENGDVHRLMDPYAFFIRNREDLTAIIYEPYGKHNWNDAQWIKKRRENGFKDYFRFYELDISKWLNVSEGVNGCSAYREMKDELVPYLKRTGVTHVILSLQEDFDKHVMKRYALSGEFGTPAEFMGFVDECHKNNINVFIDCSRAYQSYAVSYGDIIANAVFWVDVYHIDGFKTSSGMADDLLDYAGLSSDNLSGLKLHIEDSVYYPHITDDECNRIIGAVHDDPYSVLGPHYFEAEDTLVVRTCQPAAERVFILPEDDPFVIYEMHRIHQDGVFETGIVNENKDFKYNFFIFYRDGRTLRCPDPYAFRHFLLTDFDRYLFAQGRHYEIYEKLGAHIVVNEGVKGVNFAVWAPNALSVSVVGPFNQWDGRYHQMQRHTDGGIWEVFIPGLDEGELYKYEIRTQRGGVELKSDPFAFLTEVPPKTASVVHEVKNKHKWADEQWMKKRETSEIWRSPVSIYEVHIGSWMKKPGGRFFSYKELASKLIPYVREMGFTHIELLPIAEHPYYPSWGYQISNFYAVTSRYGTPEELMEFVDMCHQNDIGVILDWVPAHFPKDAHALAAFDGTCLFEHADPRMGEHRDWGTLIFNYGRFEVRNFLMANALFWLRYFHFDGLRVDAVASMLYLDYSRKAGEWIPNKFGGNENLEAIEFLKITNTAVHEEFPGVMMIAEESTAWPSVSRPVEHGGLGFGFKWNMGWMHDVLHYMSKDSVHRKYHHKDLTFGILYAFNENFILSFSHDEVVHLKGSMIEKMYGTEWEKFANLRLLYTFMYCHPGKKLLFMGGEFGQWSEWDYASELDWHLLERNQHSALRRFVIDLNMHYRKEKALHEVDFNSHGFEWIDADNADENIIAFVRKARDPRNCLFAVMNFSSLTRENYRLGVPFPVFYRELINSDSEKYGGSGSVLPDGGVMAEDVPWKGYEFSVSVYLPAFGAIILKPAPPVDLFEPEHDEQTEKKIKKMRKKKKKNRIRPRNKKKDFWKDKKESVFRIR